MRKLILATFLALASVASSWAEVPTTPVAIHSSEWIRKEAGLRYASWNRKIYEVNNFLNAQPHKLAMSPAGTLYVLPVLDARCQDYATLKQIMLERLGVRSELLTVMVRKSGQLHTFVAATLADGTMVGLDNRFRDPTTEALRGLEYQSLPQQNEKHSFRINELLKQ